MERGQTQISVIKHLLSKGEIVTGSTAYKFTNAYTGVGTLNLHKIIAQLRKQGLNITDEWAYNEDTKTRYKKFYIKSKLNK